MFRKLPKVLLLRPQDEDSNLDRPYFLNAKIGPSTQGKGVFFLD